MSCPSPVQFRPPISSLSLLTLPPDELEIGSFLAEMHRSHAGVEESVEDVPKERVVCPPEGAIATFDGVEESVENVPKVRIVCPLEDAIATIDGVANDVLGDELMVCKQELEGMQDRMALIYGQHLLVSKFMERETHPEVSKYLPFVKDMTFCASSGLRDPVRKRLNHLVVKNFRRKLTIQRRRSAFNVIKTFQPVRQDSKNRDVRQKYKVISQAIKKIAQIAESASEASRGLFFKLEKPKDNSAAAAKEICDLAKATKNSLVNAIPYPERIPKSAETNLALLDQTLSLLGAIKG